MSTTSGGGRSGGPRAVERLALGAAGLAAFLALVEVLPRIGAVSPDYLPPTSRIARALGDELADGAFWSALGATLTAWALALLIAALGGVAAGAVISTVPFLRKATASTVEFLRPIPSVALIPLAVLLYGTGLGASLLLAVYASFWQILVQVLQGTLDVDPVADETARAYRLSALSRLRHVTLPSTLPYLATGIRLAAAVALILSVTAELVIGAPGLGASIAVAQSSQAVPDLYALIAVTGLLGLTVNLGARAVERRVLAWHPSVRAEEPV